MSGETNPRHARISPPTTPNSSPAAWQPWTPTTEGTSDVTDTPDPWGPYRATIEDQFDTCADYLGRLRRSLAGEIAPDRHYFADKAHQLHTAARRMVRIAQDIDRWLGECPTTVEHTDSGGTRFTAPKGAPPTCPQVLGRECPTGTAVPSTGHPRWSSDRAGRATPSPSRRGSGSMNSPSTTSHPLRSCWDCSLEASNTYRVRCSMLVSPTPSGRAMRAL
jgi:hypothetical protein